jgi:hypothetical protein
MKMQTQSKSDEETSPMQLLVVQALSDGKARLSVPELALKLRKRAYPVGVAVSWLEKKGVVRATKEEDAARFYRWELVTGE